MLTPNSLLKLPSYRPYVEYKGSVPQAELHSKQKELELEANNLISKGGKVAFLYSWLLDYVFSPQTEKPFMCAQNNL